MTQRLLRTLINFILCGMMSCPRGQDSVKGCALKPSGFRRVYWRWLGSVSCLISCCQAVRRPFVGFVFAITSTFNLPFLICSRPRTVSNLGLALMDRGSLLSPETGIPALLPLCGYSMALWIMFQFVIYFTQGC